MQMHYTQKNIHEVMEQELLPKPMLGSANSKNLKRIKREKNEKSRLIERSTACELSRERVVLIMLLN